MEIDPVGWFEDDFSFDDSYVSAPYTLNYFGNPDVEFHVEGYETDQNKVEFQKAIQNAVSLNSEDVEEIASYVHQFYKQYEDPRYLDFAIPYPEEVWDYVAISFAYVSRRSRRDRKVYVSFAGVCDWEEEHGFQFVLRDGCRLVRVSTQDGHLTTADAYDRPESEDSILPPS